MNRNILSGRRTFWILILPLALYAAALNPYFLPDQYDNIVYHYGAGSLAETGTYRFEGKYIVDWPPVTSALLSLPFLAGAGSVWASKCVILLCVGAGLALVYRLLIREGRPRPLLVCLFFALLPSGVMMGTRVMSEWPFIVTSFLFLNLLDAMDRGRRDVRFAVLTGCALGAAALTRYAGVLAGAAVAAQALAHIRCRGKEAGVRAALPEGIAAFTGAALFGAWKVKLAFQIHAGTANSGNWGNWGFLSTNYINPLRHSPLDIVDTVNDLFYRSSSIVQYLGIENPLLLGVISLPALVVFTGLIDHIRSGRLRPSDWYVLTTMALFAVAKWKLTRHWLPIAPFLICFFVSGLALICRNASRLLRVRADRPFRAVLACWMAALLALNGYLLCRGNVRGTHGGLCMLVSPDAGRFYEGYWRELYQVCRIVKSEAAPGPVAIMGEPGGIGKYVLAFSGHSFTGFPPDRGPVSFVVSQGSSEVSEQVLNRYGLKRVYSSKDLALFRVNRLHTCAPSCGAGLTMGD